MNGMERFVSAWADGKTLSESYVFPPDQRPGDLVVPTSKESIPVVDMGKAGSHDHSSLVSQIMQSCREFGTLQIVNHGVSKKLMDEARYVFKEFFELPMEEKFELCYNDGQQKCIIYTSSLDYENEAFHAWKDALEQKCAPLDECIPYWPQKPARYRKIVAKYVTEVKELGLRIMKLISEGLGLELDYFTKELSQDMTLIVNHYPPCPDPRLTLGVPKHGDKGLITILLQEDISGFQVFKDGDWIAVEPNLDAFIVNIGHALQVISNGEMKNEDHRVVTNKEVSRHSVALSILPSQNSLVEPTKALVNNENPPLFKSFIYKEFLSNYNKTHLSKLYGFVLDPFRTT